MATMSFGYTYDRGVRVGYDISVPGIILHQVSSKDKNRIIKELKDAGNKETDILIERNDDI